MDSIVGEHAMDSSDEGSRRPQRGSAVTAAIMAIAVLFSFDSAGTNQSEIGASVIAAGLLLGPSAGYFYGGCSRRALAGIGIRAGISAITLAVMAVTPPVDGPDIDIVIGGAGLPLVSAEGLYECFTVGKCVRDHSVTY